jgi:hypothetical protein
MWRTWRISTRSVLVAGLPSVSAPTRDVTGSWLVALLDRGGVDTGVEAMSPLVQMILSQPGMAERLIAEHVDDGSGRCRGCPVGGQRGRHSWPCTLRMAAEEAERIEAARSA